jgi:hypothetical protein
VSYLFIAIVWVNHHHLLRFAEHATPRLIWWNFAHLFVVSLVPFSTVWIAVTRFAAVPVAVYAAIICTGEFSIPRVCLGGVGAGGSPGEDLGTGAADDSSSIVRDAGVFSHIEVFS